eukprot:Hpha_TRINITY_DN15593_c5_g5::TRINITY_DN15593_c5_g5_i1::g.104846::m.104846
MSLESPTHGGTHDRDNKQQKNPRKTQRGRGRKADVPPAQVTKNKEQMISCFIHLAAHREDGVPSFLWWIRGCCFSVFHPRFQKKDRRERGSLNEKQGEDEEA